MRDGGLPIATGENLHTLYEFKQMIASGGVTFPEPDVTNCGGVTAFIKIAHMAEAFNLPITSHGAHDITIQLLAAVPNRSYLEVHGFGLERFLTHSLGSIIIASHCPWCCRTARTAISPNSNSLRCVYATAWASRG